MASTESPQTGLKSEAKRRSSSSRLVAAGFNVSDGSDKSSTPPSSPERSTPRSPTPIELERDPKVKQVKQALQESVSNILDVSSTGFDGHAAAAFGQFRRSVSMSSELPTDIFEVVLDGVSNKDVILQFLARVAKEKKMYVKQVKVTLDTLLKCKLWQDAWHQSQEVVTLLPANIRNSFQVTKRSKGETPSVPETHSSPARISPAKETLTAGQISAASTPSQPTEDHDDAMSKVRDPTTAQNNEAATVKPGDEVQLCGFTGEQVGENGKRGVVEFWDDEEEGWGVQLYETGKFALVDSDNLKVMASNQASSSSAVASSSLSPSAAAAATADAAQAAAEKAAANTAAAEQAAMEEADAEAAAESAAAEAALIRESMMQQEAAERALAAYAAEEEAAAKAAAEKAAEAAEEREAKPAADGEAQGHQAPRVIEATAEAQEPPDTMLAAQGFGTPEPVPENKASQHQSDEALRKESSGALAGVAADDAVDEISPPVPTSLRKREKVKTFFRRATLCFR